MLSHIISNVSIFTLCIHGVTLVLFLRRASDHETNVSSVRLLLALLWSPPAPEENISLFGTKSFHRIVTNFDRLLFGAGQLYGTGDSLKCFCRKQLTAVAGINANESSESEDKQQSYRSENQNDELNENEMIYRTEEN